MQKNTDAFTVQLINVSFLHSWGCLGGMAEALPFPPVSHCKSAVQVLAALVTFLMEGCGICNVLLSWGQLWRFFVSALLFTMASGLVLAAYCIGTSPVEVVTFGYSYMPISAVLSYFAFNRRYGRLEWLSVGMLSLGVFAFVLLREESREGKELRFQLKGLLVVFASVVCSATGSILAERVFKERSWGGNKQDRFYIMKFHLDLTATFIAAVLWLLPLKRLVVFRDFMLRWERSEDWFGHWGTSQYLMVAVMVAHGWAAGLITREFSTVIRSVVQTLALLSTWLIGDPLQDNHLSFLQRCVPSWLLYLIVIMAALIFQTGRVNLKVIRKACNLSIEVGSQRDGELVTREITNQGQFLEYSLGFHLPASETSQTDVSASRIYRNTVAEIISHEWEAIRRKNTIHLWEIKVFQSRKKNTTSYTNLHGHKDDPRRAGPGLPTRIL
eukprot:symbB.v1.2.007835.t1/scaffold463.1/size291460/16